jgi:hypothetical protein
MVFFFSKHSSETGFCECVDALEAGFSTWNFYPPQNSVRLYQTKYLPLYSRNMIHETLLIQPGNTVCKALVSHRKCLEIRTKNTET